MTGRKGRVVSRPDGTVAFESRAEQGLSIDHVNLREKQRFMSGEKVRPSVKELRQFCDRRYQETQGSKDHRTL
jgi:hypothetical protein